MQYFLALAEPLDVADDAALEQQFDALLLAFALIGDDDRDAFIQECQFPQTGVQRLEAELGRLREDFHIRPELDGRAARFGLPDDLEVTFRFAEMETHEVDLAVAF